MPVTTIVDANMWMQFLILSHGSHEKYAINVLAMNGWRLCLAWAIHILSEINL